MAAPAPAPAPLPPRRQGRSAGFWIVAVLAVLGAIAGGFVILQFLLGGSGANRVQVPNLDGLTVQEAERSLDEVNLRLGAQTAELSERPSGTIIAQQPASGEMLEQGQGVNVTVSSGKEQATVPQLVGLTSIESARVALSDAGLQLGQITEQDSEQPQGYVLEQDPAEGEQVDAGSMVSIVVSTGSVVVPDVIGSSEAQARSDIFQAGFDVQVIYQETDSAPGGTVLAQSPQPDQALERGSVVTITVATSPRPTQEPLPTAVPSAGDIITDAPTAAQ